ncbi:putative phosphatidylinositol 4-kinase [Trypanosoma grayi]|uniref:putative phosphatidylinositol 4-kinase n=1 Tax=Trypanosoma grayi TaxID=71804 RepID=UPI0004F437EC|nr:putative phosphatidylinositol 4-kinase [Trypanosoma grayi]KEG11678.1 putative phosphatidylinositol 4-kinase [Trypanosoma grayi]
MRAAPDSSLRRHELVERLLGLPNAARGEQVLLVNELYDTPLPTLEEALLQVSHVCISHNGSEVQNMLRNFMLWLAGQSFSIALRLAWTVDSVVDIFGAVGLGERVREVQDKIESYAINRRGATKKGNNDEVTEAEIARKEMRLKLYNDERQFLNTVTSLSNYLRTLPDRQMRNTELKIKLRAMNESLSSLSLIYPLGADSDPVMWILSIVVDDCVVFSSRERAPFLLRFEVIVDDTTTMNDPTASELRQPNGKFKITADSEEILDTTCFEEAEADGECASKSDGEGSNKKRDAFRCVFGEMPQERAARIRKKSAFGRHPKWGLASIIVKAGDDLRQEELALQLIDVFNRIWREAGLTCSVHPYRALSVSSDSGVIECVDAACSVDGIKRSSQVVYIAQFFNEVFGAKGSETYLRAQRNFVETMAGYSIVSYMLQIKDRHNGNLMITSEGHLVHIDFGFMLVTSPGGINFESAPFKLSQELLEVMGGVGSAAFNYFKVLMYQGMMAVRERAEDILGLVSLMTPYSTMPCFGSDPVAAVQQLRSRFRFDLETEADFALYVKELIMLSVDNWRTRRYDQFQSLQNGIL